MTQGPHGADNPAPDGPDEVLAKAVEALAKAINDKRVDPICAAYQQVRAALGRASAQAPTVVTARLGEMPMRVVVSAYSHRHCFMCAHGVLQCQTCDGAGTLQGDQPCPSCQGLSVEPCGFCQGTGWADFETIPPEIRPQVHARQAAHVEQERKRFAEEVAAMTAEKFARLPKSQRPLFAGLLMRLTARATVLLEANIIRDPNVRRVFAKTVEQAQSTLVRFRASGPK